MREQSLRRPAWSEVSWVTLADGQRWCLPDPSAVPGHDRIAYEAGKVLAASVAALAGLGRDRIDPARHDTETGKVLVAAAWMNTVVNVHAVYQSVYKAASHLLAWNYDLTEGDCEILMPFNFRTEDGWTPDPRLALVTAQTLVMFNEVATRVGLDVADDLRRICPAA